MSNHLEQLKREMRSPDAITDLLETNRWMKELNWANIDQFSRFLALYSAEPDQVIFAEGDESTYLSLIVDGSVDIYKSDSQDEQRRLATLGSGQAFGEMALIETSKRSASAKATSPTTLLVIDNESFESLCLEYPDLGLVVVRRIARDLSGRLRLSSDILVDHLHE